VRHATCQQAVTCNTSGNDTMVAGGYSSSMSSVAAACNAFARSSACNR
jgi:hypothetical protein